MFSGEPRTRQARVEQRVSAASCPRSGAAQSAKSSFEPSAVSEWARWELRGGIYRVEGFLRNCERKEAPMSANMVMT